MYVKKKKKEKNRLLYSSFSTTFHRITTCYFQNQSVVRNKKKKGHNEYQIEILYIYIYHLTNDKLILEWTSAIPKTLTLL